MLTVTTYAQVSKALGRLVRSLVDSTKLFVRWMDGTCVETPEQKGPNEDEEPVNFTFYWDVASNPAVIKSMLTLNQAIQKAIHGVGRYIEGWRRHASLWKTDKGSVLDKFKARDPPCGVSRNWWALLLQLVAVEPRGVQSGRELQAE